MHCNNEWLSSSGKSKSPTNAGLPVKKATSFAEEESGVLAFC